jgi:hypothetical protein
MPQNMWIEPKAYSISSGIIVYENDGKNKNDDIILTNV